MLDNSTIYLLLVAFILGGAIGSIIGMLILDSVFRKGHQKVWEALEKITIEVQAIENKFSKTKKTDFQTPPKITLKVIIKEILENYDKLKVILSKIKKVEFVKDTETPTISHHSDLKDDEVIQVEETIDEPLMETHSSQGGLFSDNFGDIPKNFNTEPENLTSQLVRLYNRGVDNRTTRHEFWEKFSVTRIDNNNAVAQRMGEVSEPDFRESSRGDFLAVENSDNQTYLVVPQFDTTITSEAFNEGGIGFVFDCPNYNPQSAYSVVKVEKPAIFRREGERWFLVDGKKGRLNLQS